MQRTVLRHLLVLDWAKIENTPAPERRPARLELWYRGARALAADNGSELAPLVAELQSAAGEVARRERHEVLADLARDLAVHQALGEDVGTGWRRRTRRLAEVMGLPSSAIRERIEHRAAAIEVVIQPEPGVAT